MWNFFTQFHHTGESGQSNIEFTVKDNSSLVMISNSGNPAQPTEHDYNLGPLVRGRWADFVFHVKWSSDPNVGYVEVYMNGSLVVQQTATATIYPGQNVYLKQGFYRAACSCTTVLYQDGTRRGSSYGDVVADFPAGTWPSSPGGSVPAQPATTTTAAPPPPATTTAATPPPATTKTTTTTAPATTKTTTTTAPATTKTTTTAPPPPTGGSGSSSGPGTGPAAQNGKPKAKPQLTRSVAWDGRQFSSAGSLRTLLAHESGTSWEAFLDLHPAAAQGLKLVQVEYGQAFYTKQALARWLAGHNQRYSAWAKNHPKAAAVLAAQPADTRVSDRLSLTARSKQASRMLEIHAHAFPGAKGRLAVRSGKTSLYTTPVVVDDTGRIDTRVTLSAWHGQRHLTVRLTAAYPEGARSKQVNVSVANPARTPVSHRK